VHDLKAVTGDSDVNVVFIHKEYLLSFADYINREKRKINASLSR